MIHKHVAYIEQAAQAGAQIVCLQEIFYGPYFCAEQTTRWYDFTEPIPDGPTVKLMQDLAKKLRVAIIVPISVLLIFLLLFDAFGSFKSAALIVLNIPFAMVGGILALLFTGINLSVSAAIGFIALFGQAVLNGVVMVTYFNQLRNAGTTTEKAVLEGSLVRLRTVLMTGLLAMLGLLPMALSHGIGVEAQKPLAVVVIGGLISATLLTLLVRPTLDPVFHQEPAPLPEQTPHYP